MSEQLGTSSTVRQTLPGSQSPSSSQTSVGHPPGLFARSATDAQATEPETVGKQMHGISSSQIAPGGGWPSQLSNVAVHPLPEPTCAETGVTAPMIMGGNVADATEREPPLDELATA